MEEALVDVSAYMVDEQNDTTAFSHTRDGIEMQVSFFLAQPPRVSYFCVSCANNQPTELWSEPRLVTTEGNLALFLLTHGRYRSRHNYYVYRAPVSVSVAPPMLEKVRHPEQGLFLNSEACYFDDDEVGFLRYRPDDFDAYKIAALRTDDSNPRMSRCNLYTYDSRSTAWDRKTVVLADQRYKGHLATHRSYIVINIGGDAGTMGWVDLEKGIILCDVLGGKDDSPTSRLVRYIPLPDAGPVKKKNTLRDTGVVYFMAKVDEMEEQAWVMAVDTKKKVLRGVTEFAPRCRYSMEFTYMPTTISKYLSPGTKGNMKRPGMLLPGSAQKKLRPTHPSYGSGSCAQNAHNVQVKQEDEGTDYMDLE